MGMRSEGRVDGATARMVVRRHGDCRLAAGKYSQLCSNLERNDIESVLGDVRMSWILRNPRMMYLHL